MRSARREGDKFRNSARGNFCGIVREGDKLVTLFLRLPTPLSHEGTPKWSRGAGRNARSAGGLGKVGRDKQQWSRCE